MSWHNLAKFFQQSYFMKAIQWNLRKIELLSCILIILWVIDSFLVVLITSCKIYLFPKELKWTAVFQSRYNETECILLLCLSLRSITYTPSFTLCKLSLVKTPLKRRFIIEIVTRYRLKDWAELKLFIQVIISSSCSCNHFSQNFHHWK